MAKPIHMTASNARSMPWPLFASIAAFESLVMGLSREVNSIAVTIAQRTTASRDCVTVTISGFCSRAVSRKRPESPPMDCFRGGAFPDLVQRLGPTARMPGPGLTEPPTAVSAEPIERLRHQGEPLDRTGL